MVDPQIQETFYSHVKGYRALGNGNFGVTDGFLDPDLEILADWNLNGSLIVRSSKFSSGYNCARTANELGLSLQGQGFDVKRQFSISQEGYIQNYLLVKDPQTDTWIQLDASPWFQKIDTTHKPQGEIPIFEDPVPKSLVISPFNGEFLSTKELDDGTFVDAYLSGGVYRQANTNGNVQPLVSSAKNKGLGPYYTFRLWSRQGPTCISETLSNAAIRYEVSDTVKIMDVIEELGNNGWVDHPQQYLERLVEIAGAHMLVESHEDLLILIFFHCL